MTDIISKLVKDLKWRISGAGKKYRPKAKEIKSWGAFQVPRVVPWLVWAAYVIFITAGSDSFPWLATEHLPGLIIGGPIGIVWSGLLVRWLTLKTNSSMTLKAYQELLQDKERFTLVEYSRYLQRQIKRAGEDSTIGGDAEMKRLKELNRKLRTLLHEGAGKDGQTISSDLSEEAELAQAVVDTYGELLSDPLEQLDARLPDNILESLAELDQEQSQH